METLPYISTTLKPSLNILPDTAPIDYTTHGGLWDSRDPLGVRDPARPADDPAYVQPWEVPLAVGRRAAEVVLGEIIQGLRALKWTPVSMETIEWTPEEVGSVDEGYMMEVSDVVLFL